MASVITRRGFTYFADFTSRLPPFSIAIRKSSRVEKEKPKRGTIKHRNLIAADCESLADRGFLRNLKPYAPEPDAAERTRKILDTHLKSDYKLTDELSATSKFFILENCFTEFDHGVPNSKLHTIATPADVVEFYTTPASATVPFDELKKRELPPNLHIMYEYDRYDAATDTRFGGVSAFPESPTVVTGLRYKGKYSGSPSAKLPEHYYNEAVYYKQKGDSD